MLQFEAITAVVAEQRREARQMLEAQAAATAALQASVDQVVAAVSGLKGRHKVMPVRVHLDATGVELEPPRLANPYERKPAADWAASSRSGSEFRFASGSPPGGPRPGTAAPGGMWGTWATGTEGAAAHGEPRVAPTPFRFADPRRAATAAAAPAAAAVPRPPMLAQPHSGGLGSPLVSPVVVPLPYAATAATL